MLNTTPASSITSPANERIPICSLHDIRYTRAGQTLVDCSNVNIAEDSLTVVMGPNGAGKSLLIRLLHRLIEPDSGRITWRSESCNERQAMVFQRPVLLRRSALANIEFVLSSRGKQRTSEAMRCLRRVGLAAFAKQPARLLSGGEQQRLALARALACRPRILFLDEPSANLDPSATAAIEEIVRDAHHAKTKIVMVTHDIGQAKRLADDLIFMAYGRVEEHALASDFFDQPTSTLARKFLAGELIV